MIMKGCDSIEDRRQTSDELPMTVYCYDTEFLEDGNTIDLISIGIVCEDGREYYAANSDMDQKRISQSDWLMKNVVPHLPVNNPPEKFEQRTWIWSLNTMDSRVLPRWVIANQVRDFLLAKPNPQLWAYYGAYDHVALMQLWGPMIRLPKGLPMWTHDLMQLLEKMPEDFETPVQGNEHNALDDARWNMALLKAMA